MQLKRGSRRTLGQLFARPTRGTIRWKAIEALLLDLGADLTEREGSRIGIYLFGEVRVFHRPHPSPDTDKGAVTSIRNWLKENGIEP
jgi:HicA-like toxin of HicAB toxin-antitoxin system